MFHSSSIHNFDTMFVILCVIAGATTHDIPNSSKPTLIYKSNSRYKTSFIELLLESDVTEVRKSLQQASNELDNQPFWRHSYRAGVHELLKSRKESFVICAQLSNILNRAQIRFCQKHHDLLIAILPQVIHLTRKECARITHDLRWNCSTLDFFLDRTNSLAFTREGALMRSLINASMMYVSLRTCESNQHLSCGCQLHEEYIDRPALSSKSKDPINNNRAVPLDEHSSTAPVALSDLDLKQLETGSPLRLTRSMIRRKDAFTRTFMDADDTRSLNKAYNILNEDSTSDHGNHDNLGHRRFADADQKDLSFIKWTKSAVNLHNSHIGRQVTRDSVIKHCRCHGVSGMCQYQTCWDRLSDISIISSKLKEIYLTQSDLVKATNIGTFSSPDLYLAKSNIRKSLSEGANQVQNSSDRIGKRELAYLYQSPDYCDAHPSGWYAGTVGRECIPTPIREVLSNDLPYRASQPKADWQPKLDGGELGTCARLCCDRGFYSELILDFVDCDCRFKFCCKVECARCLRQRMRHYCR